MSKFHNAILFFDGHQRSVNWSDAQLKAFSLKLRRHRVKYVRVCPFWWERVPNMPMPWLKNGGYYDLDKPNPAYDDALRRFARWVHAGTFWNKVIGGTPEIWFDLFDNCASGRPWSPWINNLQGIHGIYEYNDKAIGYYKAWIKRIFGILGKRAHYGLGNELTFPAWQNVAEANKWGERWVLELANYMKSLGMRLPFSFSADMSVGGTSSRITGWLTEEKTQYKISYYPSFSGSRIAQYVWVKNEEEARQCTDTATAITAIEETGRKFSGGYGGRDGKRLIHVVHGMGLPEHWREVWDADILGRNLGLGVSEDGVGMGARIIPPKLRGHCEEPNVRCGVNRAGFVSMVRSALSTMWAGDRLRLVERMPKEIAMSYKSIDLLDEDVSLGVFDDLREN